MVIEATQWFCNGDHPEDGVSVHSPCPGVELAEDREGKVVRYYRLPGISGENTCAYCYKTFHEHGWIDTLEGGHIVCPGDWIITGVKGERYPCKPSIFEATYEPMEGTGE